MALFLDSSLLGRPHTISNPFLPRRLQIPSQIIRPFSHPNSLIRLNIVHPPAVCSIGFKASARREESHARIEINSVGNDAFFGLDLGDWIRQKRAWFVPMLCGGSLVVRCQMALASGGVTEVGTRAIEHVGLTKSIWTPKFLHLLFVLREQGLILAALLGLSAFFSMAKTSITILWPCKVRELAEKEPENGVFRMLRSDVTRFLTTILIGRTVVNIRAIALVTNAATAAFGEAGVGVATGIMTVAILLLTEIIPKSVAVHNATDVARIVVRPVAWLSLILYPVGRVITFLSVGMLKIIGLKGRSEPYVTEEELKLTKRGAHQSGAIEEEEQVVGQAESSWEVLTTCVSVLILISMEEIQKKTGYVVMRADGIFDVDANTSIYRFCEELNVKVPEGHQYQTVCGFVYECFGCIPTTGESIKVKLENARIGENDEYVDGESDTQKEKYQTFKLEILAGNARKVSAVRFEKTNQENSTLNAKRVTLVFPRIMKKKYKGGEDMDRE